jgi:hypothetical protein
MVKFDREKNFVEEIKSTIISFRNDITTGFFSLSSNIRNNIYIYLF